MSFKKVWADIFILLVVRQDIEVLYATIRSHYSQSVIWKEISIQGTVREVYTLDSYRSQLLTPRTIVFSLPCHVKLDVPKNRGLMIISYRLLSEIRFNGFYS